jgi:hypothetical protein
MTALSPSSARRLAVLALVTGVAAGIAPQARADGIRGLPAGTPAEYVAECGSCHVAYPPALLPATSWARLMAKLDAHYGSDASLDAATLARIGRWLQAEAGTGRRAAVAPPEDRITLAPWFERTHRKLDATVWTLPSVRRASNCGACHGGAARGVYDDDGLTVPAGTSPRQRRAFID